MKSFLRITFEALKYNIYCHRVIFIIDFNYIFIYVLFLTNFIKIAQQKKYIYIGKVDFVIYEF
jgi:hypothetical protein